MTFRVPASRALVERLAQLQRRREQADAEARGLVAGWTMCLGQDPDAFIGYDDGPEPALILQEPATVETPAAPTQEEPVSDERQTPPEGEPAEEPTTPTDATVSVDGDGGAEASVTSGDTEPADEDADEDAS